MTPTEAVTKLAEAEAVTVPVGNAAQLAPNATDRPLWSSPDNYVMVWPTDDGLEIQVVANDEDYCAELVDAALKALGKHEFRPDAGARQRRPPLRLGRHRLTGTPGAYPVTIRKTAASGAIRFMRLHLQKTLIPTPAREVPHVRSC